MIITPLGHTEFLVDIKNSHNEDIRILVDSWLSDYVIGDLMERTVKVRLDPEKIGTIDAVYISHSHTDHLDPYTLVDLYKSEKPILLLPFALVYLVPLLREYLGNIMIEILFPGKLFFLKGIEITGYMFAQSEITNEDDVMMLGISNDRELLFAEIDTLPEDDHLEVQQELYNILTKKDYETVCYLASRNELSGQLPLLDVPEKKHATFRTQYIASRKDEMYASYQKYEYDDYADFPNIYTIPGFCRGFIGQGIAYPRALSNDFFTTQVFPLDEIASMESDIARECGYEFTQKALLPGRQYKIEKGTIEQGRKECPIGELIKNNEPSAQTQERIYASGPLFPRKLSQAEIDDAKKRILEVLRYRFLPYWSASPIASLREVLMKNNGTYRIECNISNHPPIIFEYTTAGLDFTEIPYIENIKVDEHYWLLDVLDFLDGKQELYSNFWHHLDPKNIYRLWTCLGANWMNHDIVEKKYRLHFERAARGDTVNDWVEGVYRNL